VKTANFADLWDELLGEGRSTFTVADLRERTGASLDAVYSAVKYAMDRRRLFSPVRGLYVVVPPEHRAAGVVPAVQFIDPMMRHLAVDYYVAYASAAAWWGAAHQAIQVFDVVASRHVLDRALGPVRMRFHTSSRIDTDAVRRVTGPRTMLNVASPALTAVDLAGRPRLGGGLSAVATILAELPDLDDDQLATLAARRTKPDARRLGWLLELARDDLTLDALRKIAQPEHGRATLLAPRGARQGPVDDRWGVIVNTTVEPDET
jgi:predicted transcriptional regulator of viral defense system